MTDLRISVRNLSDTGGVFTTPFWFGFHDNSFDLFESGQAASAGLESLAEDGDAAGLNGEISAADADAQTTTVAGAAGPIAPGESTSAVFTVDGSSNAYVSFAAMILPSNDAFVGNDDATQLFDENGNFIAEFTTMIAGTQVYDAGTEQNTETDAAFLNQLAPNTGTDENGVVSLHPGFNGSQGNPGGAPQNILGGTNALGEFIDPVAADFTLPGAEVVQIHINTVRTIGTTLEDDTIFGNNDDDFISSQFGRDFVSGGGGWDVIDGGRQNDVLLGNRGNDIIIGGNGSDLIRGGAEDDDLTGDNGRDTIDGGRGQDVLRGNRDDDSLRGGSDIDTFVFGNNGGNDTIQDFTDGEDLIALDIDGFADFNDVVAAATEINGGVKIDFGVEGSVFLKNVTLASLDESDFIFA